MTVTSSGLEPFVLRKHVTLRFVVHLHLEVELRLQALCTLGGWACVDLVEQSFDIRQLAERIGAKHPRQRPGPAPDGHVDQRVGIAQHVFMFGQLVIEQLEVALRLKRIAVDGIRILFGRSVLEMHGLT